MSVKEPFFDFQARIFCARDFVMSNLKLILITNLKTNNTQK